MAPCCFQFSFSSFSRHLKADAEFVNISFAHSCDRPRPPQGQQRKKSEKSPERVRWGTAPKVPKLRSLKRVRKESESQGFRLFSDRTSGRTLSALLGPALGYSFRTPPVRARKARETLCGAGPIASPFSHEQCQIVGGRLIDIRVAWAG